MENFNRYDFLNIMISDISNRIKDKTWKKLEELDITLEELEMLYKYFTCYDSSRYETPNYWGEKIIKKIIDKTPD